MRLGKSTVVVVSRQGGGPVFSAQPDKAKDHLAPTSGFQKQRPLRDIRTRQGSVEIENIGKGTRL